MSTYAQSGVDVDVEEKAAKLMYQAAKKSWANRQGKVGEILLPFDDFSGLRAVNMGGLPEGTLMNMGFDTVGTKSEFAERAGRFDTLAFDLMAMVCDDAVIRGGEPILVGSNLEVNTLGTDESRLPYIKQLADGYVKAAEAAGVAIINGETAQIGKRVMGELSPFRTNWGATCIWLAHEERMITGHDVRAGDAIVALAEPGVRCNGISLIRKVLTDKYGDDWHKHDLDGTPLIDLALTPSVIYTKALLDMVGGYDLSRPARAKVHAAAHVTGSGLPGKLGRALKPVGLGATIDAPLEPNQLMLHVQEIGEVSDFEAYRTWHMGQGMVIVTPEPHAVLSVARSHHIEASVIGTVNTSATIRIASRGHFAAREHWLEY
ncbi:MAG: Phosphoribosylformylglycinamidine cyclo-ligase [Candidatus Saccharibacteria bacterium]|jgi:phosphoribosylformylglycinamidine cyclo-ligase|nr:Phosphoribosylformylglycinamidine cyclo-ligase [Candidatus Saccharibacteria bacterium]